MRGTAFHWNKLWIGTGVVVREKLWSMLAYRFRTMTTNFKKSSSSKRIVHRVLASICYGKLFSITMKFIETFIRFHSTTTTWNEVNQNLLFARHEVAIRVLLFQSQFFEYACVRSSAEKFQRIWIALLHIEHVPLKADKEELEEINCSHKQHSENNSINELRLLFFYTHLTHCYHF